MKKTAVITVGLTLMCAALYAFVSFKVPEVLQEVKYEIRDAQASRNRKKYEWFNPARSVLYDRIVEYRDKSGAWPKDAREIMSLGPISYRLESSMKWEHLTEVDILIVERRLLNKDVRYKIRLRDIDYDCELTWPQD